MRTRCLNPKSEGYAEYGARGITVCARWASFEAFLLDMGERPAGTTLDRRNNDRGYEPGNCRWATMSEQENNKRVNVFIEHDGLRLTVAEWAAKTGIGYQTLRKRVEAGWSAARVVGEPAQRR